jgi:hypothetical protein
VHLLADTCEVCDSRSIFYVFSAKNKELQPVWKFFAGTGAQCGLKDISFNSAEIILETFGNCAFKNSSIVEENQSKKTDITTKFIFNYKDGTFYQNSKENFPFKQSEILNYQSQIKFGN